MVALYIVDSGAMWVAIDTESFLSYFVWHILTLGIQIMYI